MWASLESDIWSQLSLFLLLKNTVVQYFLINSIAMDSLFLFPSEAVLLKKYKNKASKPKNQSEEEKEYI